MRLHKIKIHLMWKVCRSQWPRCVRCGFAAACWLGLRVRISSGQGCLSVVIVVCCQVVSATGWCVQWAWSRSPLWGGHDPELGQSVTGKKRKGEKKKKGRGECRMLQEFCRIIRGTSAKGSISFVMCILLSVRTEQFCSTWEDFLEMIEEFLLKSLDQIQVWLKCNKTRTVFAWIPILLWYLPG
jgi:hypothetical protein